MFPFTLHTQNTAPAGSQGVMEAYVQKFGFVPNLIGILAESPAAVQGYAQTYGLLNETDSTPAEQQLLFLTAGYTNAQILEVLLAVATKTISNYMNHIAETPLDTPFQSSAWLADDQAA